MKHDRNESVLSAPVSSAKIRTGNILSSLFKYSRDKLWMRDDNIINFVSCDGVLTTPIGRELINHSLVRSSDIKAAKGEIGYITSIRKRGKFVYNLFIKETFDASTFAKSIELAVDTLRKATQSLKDRSFSLARSGNGLDQIPWAVTEQIFRAHFGKSGYTITICTGDIDIPPETDRLTIIQENHDSTVGGHKGETKIYERIRERFYWKGMREEIRDYVRLCESCQKKKLTR